MSMGIAVVCMRGYDYTVKHLQNWLLEGEILDYFQQFATMF